MIAKLMRRSTSIRPWMVATALACGSPVWAPACGSDDSDGDVPSDATEATADGDVGDGADCEPGDLYGPATCTTDEECIARLGPGAFCNPAPLFVDDGCGNLVEWGRICDSAAADADADGDDVARLYGPLPADADADD